MKFLQGKTQRFMASVVTMAVALLTIIIYTLLYSSTRYMAWESVGFIVSGAVLAAALLVLKQTRFVPSLLLVANTIGAMFFVYHIYFFISSVAVGIQFSGFPPEFFASVVLFVVTVLCSAVSVFMPDTEKK